MNKFFLFLVEQTESRNAVATIRMFVVHPAKALALIMASTLLLRNTRFSPFLGVRMSPHGGVTGRLYQVAGTHRGGVSGSFTGQDDKARCTLTLTVQTVKVLGAGKGGQDVEVYADQAAEAAEDCLF